MTVRARRRQQLRAHHTVHPARDVVIHRTTLVDTPERPVAFRTDEALATHGAKLPLAREPRNGRGIWPLLVWLTTLAAPALGQPGAWQLDGNRLRGALAGRSIEVAPERIAVTIQLEMRTQELDTGQTTMRCPKPLACGIRVRRPPKAGLRPRSSSSATSCSRPGCYAACTI